MTYERPVLHHEGAIDDVLQRLVSTRERTKPSVDSRVRALLRHLDSHTGVEWDLKDACTELKLDISAAYAARLFKLHIGVGVREYAKRKRLLLAAKRLTTTNLPIKVIAADLGYRNPVDFTRTFKEQYHLCPSKYRKEAA